MLKGSLEKEQVADSIGERGYDRSRIGVLGNRCPDLHVFIYIYIQLYIYIYIYIYILNIYKYIYVCTYISMSVYKFTSFFIEKTGFSLSLAAETLKKQAFTSFSNQLDSY